MLLAVCTIKMAASRNCEKYNSAEHFSWTYVTEMVVPNVNSMFRLQRIINKTKINLYNTLAIPALL
jgi:hypothetical protein